MRERPEQKDPFNTQIDVGSGLDFPEKQDLPKPGPVDKEAVEREATERDSEHVLDAEKPKKEPEETSVESAKAQETKIGESREEQAEEYKRMEEELKKADLEWRKGKIKEEVEAELRKIPVRLTKQEVLEIQERVLNEQKQEILDSLPEDEEGKKAYPDHHTVKQSREMMLINMVENGVVAPEQADSFCSKEAFYGLLKEGYDAGGVKSASFGELMKEAFWGWPIIQQIKTIRRIMGEGELLSVPRLDGKKELIPFEGFQRKIGTAEQSFQDRIIGARDRERTRFWAEKTEQELKKRVEKRLEQEEKAKTKGGDEEDQHTKAEPDETVEEREEKVRRAASLWEKTYEIDRALRRKRKSFDNFKYKKVSKDGTESVETGEKAKRMAQRDKHTMSKELVVLAQEISGRNFMEDAKAIKPKWKKRDLERYITEQVQLVLESEGIKFTKDKPLQKNQQEPESEQEKGFEDTLSEYKDDFKKGKTGFCIHTKIPHGKTYRGYTENSRGFELYEIYREEGSMPEEISKKLGNFSFNKEKGNWIGLGDAFVMLGSSNIEIRKRARGRLGKMEIEERPLTLKDAGFSSEDEVEELCEFSIGFRPSPSSGYKEHRDHYTAIDFLIKKSLAEKLLLGIKKDPQNLWRFLKIADPKLMEIISPLNEEAPTILVYDEYEGARHEDDYPEYQPTEVIGKKEKQG